MKSDIHPDYHPVLFLDVSNGFEFLTNSTMTSDERRTVDGVDAYVVRLDITSESHPFFTGEQRIVDTQGRVERFRRRYSQANEDTASVAENNDDNSNTESN
tara:strand:+ start:1038 stop:1340 length:303 start_codon:yes stop_codon:yes gene_type:complete